MSDNEFETEAALSDECHIYQQIVVWWIRWDEQCRPVDDGTGVTWLRLRSHWYEYESNPYDVNKAKFLLI